MELKKCDRKNFHFSNLQRVSPDMAPEESIALESARKERLGTRSHTFGLNRN